MDIGTNIINTNVTSVDLVVENTIINKNLKKNYGQPKELY